MSNGQLQHYTPTKSPEIQIINPDGGQLPAQLAKQLEPMMQQPGPYTVTVLEKTTYVHIHKHAQPAGGCLAVIALGSGLIASLSWAVSYAVAG